MACQFSGGRVCNQEPAEQKRRLTDRCVFWKNRARKRLWNRRGRNPFEGVRKRTVGGPSILSPVAAACAGGAYGEVMVFFWRRALLQKRNGRRRENLASPAAPPAERVKCPPLSAGERAGF